MNQKIVYQVDLAGRLVGETMADESPLEPGVWLMPARTVETAPPAEYPEGTWPRWTGGGWSLTGSSKPMQATPDDPVQKLQAFLLANPDVAALMP